jgi:hypothetical protein
VNADLGDRRVAWTAAELSGDAGRLSDLLHPDFISVGPFTPMPGHPINGVFRVTLVITDEPLWRFFSAHLSQRHLPTTPS